MRREARPRGVHRRGFPTQIIIRTPRAASPRPARRRMSRFSRTSVRASPVPRTATSTIVRARLSARITWFFDSGAVTELFPGAKLPPAIGLGKRALLSDHAVERVRIALHFSASRSCAIRNELNFGRVVEVVVGRCFDSLGNKALRATRPSCNKGVSHASTVSFQVRLNHDRDDRRRVDVARRGPISAA